jgi:hypothetical protein
LDGMYSLKRLSEIVWDYFISGQTVLSWSNLYSDL